MAENSLKAEQQNRTNRIAFLFGAGADPICYYGDEFTKEFLYKQRLSIRSIIIEQLQAIPEFQNQMFNDEYASFIGEYREQKFSSFENQVMCRTLKQVIEEEGVADTYAQVTDPEITDPVLLEFLRIAKYVYSDQEYQRHFRNENIADNITIPSLTGVEKSYIKNLLFKSKETPINNDLLNIEVAKAIKKTDLITYGTMEKDFHTFNNPAKYGKKACTDVIYAYWKAYYSVFLHVERLLHNKLFRDVDGVRHERAFGSMNEEKLRQHIASIASDLEKMEDFFVLGVDDENHILTLRDANGDTKDIQLDTGELYYNFPWVKDASGIITTNYTPCIKWFRAGTDISYLNGKLSTFEFPYSLEVVDCVRDPEKFNELRETRQIYFPFIMGTTSVKPIIHPLQIEEYSKAVGILQDSDTLVVIGHQLMEDDTHLLALIRDWLVHGNERNLIYCNYIKDDNNDQNTMTEQDLAKKFRYPQDRSQLHCINFSRHDRLEPKLDELLITLRV
jgi:hypothetical protein